MSPKADPPPSSDSAESADLPANASREPGATTSSSPADLSAASRTASPNSESSGASSRDASSARSNQSSTPNPPRRKPRISLFIATACGLGYLPKAPGTWGSLAGVAIYFLWPAGPTRYVHVLGSSALLWNSALITGIIAFIIAAIGVWSAHRVARFSANKDPQFVVIDEVSGQLLTYLVALAPANWKYLVLGFILFRLFDIWKPFPARQAESLPGGWGIMADDWIAGIYAGLGLWLARALGL
jgi:phosphatidylglycerophosphatase A